MTLLRDVDAMQAALVPKVPARVGGLSVSVAYRPADGPAAGGDFYDVFVPERGKIAIILGDVVGHGHGERRHAALDSLHAARLFADGHGAACGARAGGEGAGRPQLGRTSQRLPLRSTTRARGAWCTRVRVIRRRCFTACRRASRWGDVCLAADWLERPHRAPSDDGVAAPRRRRVLLHGRSDGGSLQGAEVAGRRRLSEILAGLGPWPDAEKLLAKVRAAALSTPDDMAACIVVPEMTVVPARTHIEELEADSQELERGDVRRFLETCQVLNPAIDLALDRAGDIMAVFGTAMLRVELMPHGATVKVGAPRPIAGADASHDSPQPVADPSGAR